MNKLEYLNQIPFWNLLEENEKKIVNESGVIKDYAKNTNIYNTTTECIGLIIVLKGEIKLNVISEEGKQISLYKVKKNECCVLSASCVISQITFDTEMITENDTKLLIISSNIFSKIIQNNLKIKCYMYELAIKRFSTVMWILQDILFLKMDKRIANYLINKSRETNNLILKITHEKIANDLNTAREVITRILNKFEEENFIELKRGYIKIKNLKDFKNI